MRHRWLFRMHAFCALLFFSTMAPRVCAQSLVTASDATQDAAAQEPQPAPPPADPDGFRFTGYLRSGYGIDGHGKDQQPFQAPLAGAKYRLGNEAETYLETAFLYGTHTEGDDPAYFDLRLRLAYVTPTAQSSNFSTTFSLREAYAVSKSIWAAQPTATFWAGARFYDRQDVHMNDFYYRDPSGFGGGVEDVALGDRAKLAVAWIGGTQDELQSNGLPAPQRFRFNKNSLDVRLYDVAFGRVRASVATDISQFSGDQLPSTPAPILIEDSVGASTTGIVEVPFAGGRNKVAVQYGKGAAYDFRSVITMPVGRTFQPGERVVVDDLWQFRVLDDFLIDHRGPWAMQALALYQELDNGATSNSRVRWISMGARPVRQLGRFTSLAVEAGWDHTSQGDLPGGSLFKLTVAPQITPSFKYLSRPSIRAYATLARWSDAYRGQVAAATNPNAVRGSAFGVQLETWW